MVQCAVLAICVVLSEQSKNCPIGHHVGTTFTGKIGCVACSKGKYQHMRSSSATCKFCPGGYTGPPGATECTPCLSGTYCHKGKVKVCDTAGSFCSAESSRPVPAEDGYYVEKTTMDLGFARQKPCKQGFFCKYGIRKLCPVGTFQPEQKHSSCQMCPAGHYEDGIGNSKDNCKECPAGYAILDHGASKCPKCKAGKYQQYPRGLMCYMCLPGKISSKAGQTACAKCPKGNFQHAPGKEICIPCKPGHFGTEVGSISELSCTTCDSGQYQPIAGSATCRKCAAAKSAGSSTCPTEGTKKSQVGVHSAPPGVHAGPPPGVHSGPPPGFHLGPPPGETPAVVTEDQPSKKWCAAGMYTDSAIGHLDCSLCPKGKYSNSGSARCQLCPAGRFGAGGSKGSECDGLCAAGYYGLDGSVSMKCSGACPLGRYGLLGTFSTVCSGACLAGTFGDQKEGATSPQCAGNCAKGKYSKKGGGVCLACPGKVARCFNHYTNREAKTKISCQK